MENEKAGKRGSRAIFNGLPKGRLMLPNQLKGRRAILLSLLLTAATASIAQQPDGSSAAGPAAAADRSPEDLNYVGGDTSMPPMADSLIAAENPYHKALWE